MPNESDNLKMLRFQYKTVFGEPIPHDLENKHSLVDIVITYGKMGYKESEAIELAISHQRIRQYNQLIDDDLVFRMNKKAL